MNPAARAVRLLVALAAAIALALAAGAADTTSYLVAAPIAR